MKCTQCRCGYSFPFPFVIIHLYHSLPFSVRLIRFLSTASAHLLISGAPSLQLLVERIVERLVVDPRLGGADA